MLCLPSVQDRDTHHENTIAPDAHPAIPMRQEGWITMKWKLLLFSAAVIIFAGCQPQSDTLSTVTAQATQVSGAETLVASLSLTPEVTETPTAPATPTTTLTPTDAEPAQQDQPSTITPAQSPTTASGTEASACDSASFVEDVTVPDGAQMSPGESFTKTWRLRNSGTCTWTTEYSAQLLNGVRMEGEAAPIAAAVQPGETVDVSIDFAAPVESGIYISEWALTNEEGDTFEKSFYVQIEVISIATATQAP